LKKLWGIDWIWNKGFQSEKNSLFEKLKNTPKTSSLLYFFHSKSTHDMSWNKPKKQLKRKELIIFKQTQFILTSTKEIVEWFWQHLLFAVDISHHLLYGSVMCRRHNSLRYAQTLWAWNVAFCITVPKSLKNVAVVWPWTERLKCYCLNFGYRSWFYVWEIHCRNQYMRNVKAGWRTSALELIVCVLLRCVDQT